MVFVPFIWFLNIRGEILNVLFENTTLEVQLEHRLDTQNLAHFINCNHNIPKSLFD